MLTELDQFYLSPPHTNQNKRKRSAFLGHNTCGRRRERGKRRSKSGARYLLGGYDDMGKDGGSVIVPKQLGIHIGRQVDI